MHRLLTIALAIFALSAPAQAALDPLPQAALTCTATGVGTGRDAIQLAQSDCRGHCSSMRGYCISTCRDSQCRAICNDRYQSCMSSCRR